MRSTLTGLMRVRWRGRGVRQQCRASHGSMMKLGDGLVAVQRSAVVV